MDYVRLGFRVIGLPATMGLSSSSALVKRFRSTCLNSATVGSTAGVGATGCDLTAPFGMTTVGLYAIFKCAYAALRTSWCAEMPCFRASLSKCSLSALGTNTWMTAIPATLARLQQTCYVNMVKNELQQTCYVNMELR